MSRILTIVFLMFCITSCKEKAIFYGDSIISSNPEMIKWPNIVQEQLGLDINNYGISGSTLLRHDGYYVPSFQELLTEQVPAHSGNYKYFFIAYGTNDIGLNDNIHTPEAFLAAYDSIVKSLIKIGWPAEKIIIISPYYATQAGWQQYSGYDLIAVASPQRALAFFNICKQVASQNGCRFIDVRSALNKDSYLIDGIHPTEYGHRLIAAKVLAALQ